MVRRRARAQTSDIFDKKTNVTKRPAGTSLKINPPSGGALKRASNSMAFLVRAAQSAPGPGERWRCGMDGSIFNSNGTHVGVVLGPSIFDLSGQRIYDLQGIKVYKLSGELVGHLPADARSSERRLDKLTDKLFR
jgi:hypothetical protein